MGQTQGAARTRGRLELELTRVRAEAARIRLEARAAELEERAAEIELLLLGGQQAPSTGNAKGEETALSDSPGQPCNAARLTRPSAALQQQAGDGWSTATVQLGGAATMDAAGGPDAAPSFANSHRDAAEALLQAIRELLAGEQPGAGSAATEQAASQPAANGVWQQRLSALRRRELNPAQQRRCENPSTATIASPAANGSPLAVAPTGSDLVFPAAQTAEPSGPREHAAEPFLRFDRAEPQIGFESAAASEVSAAAVADDGVIAHAPGSAAGPQSAAIKTAESVEAMQAANAAKQPTEAMTPRPLAAMLTADAKSKLRRDRSRRGRIVDRPIGLPASDPPRQRAKLPGELVATVQVQADEDSQRHRKRVRPAAWLASTIAHLAVLVLLGLMTLSTQRPRDQLAFSASVAEASEELMETFTIEVSETPLEEAQTKPEETALEISPIGTVPMAELSLDLPDAPPGPLVSDLLTSNRSLNTLAKAAGGDRPAKVSFAGVEGGGNHFAYLVDSSNSMRNFNEARLELLRSIDSLESHQRFYVVFYDQSPKYMRISKPGVDEPASVMATPANKAALRRWAMMIGQERGKSPIDVLQFAFKLRPDVIFLLSDGEFSARTEAVIREHNRHENLFGEAGPISIIHTIRYPGFSAAEARSAEVQMKRIAQENGGQYRNVQIP